MTQPKASFPHMGDYAVVIGDLAELIDCEATPAPKITRRTLEIGTRHSPEFVCIPFKYNLGNFIEAIEAGADVIIMIGGGCRFGYYGEVQQAILRDIGYDVDFIMISTDLDPRNIARFVRRYNRSVTVSQVKHVVDLTWAKVRALDEVQRFMRLRVGFETEDGAHERLYRRWLDDVGSVRDRLALERLTRSTLDDMSAVDIDKPERPMRVGVVGELYVLMEPFSNMNVEKALAARGVEVHRYCDVSGLIDHHLAGKTRLAEMVAECAPYLTYHPGAEATDTVYHTLDCLRSGFDGMIHLKPFGCMPEVSAMSALQRISRENTYPILFLSFDAQTSETGVATRLEAFCDMLSMRRKEATCA